MGLKSAGDRNIESNRNRCKLGIRLQSLSPMYHNRSRRSTTERITKTYCSILVQECSTRNRKTIQIALKLPLFPNSSTFLLNTPFITLPRDGTFKKDIASVFPDSSPPAHGSGIISTIYLVHSSAPTTYPKTHTPPQHWHP